MAYQTIVMLGNLSINYAVFYAFKDKQTCATQTWWIVNVLTHYKVTQLRISSSFWLADCINLVQSRSVNEICDGGGRGTK